jgi:c-di-GMP-binding flagellar brake protein YcgR
LGVFEAAADEWVLTTEKAAYLKGLIGFNGTVTLSDRRIHYRPNGVYRAMGVAEWELVINLIESADLVGVEQVLRIESEGEVRRLQSKGARRLHARLAAILEERGLIVTGDSTFDPGERILLQGTTRLYVNKMLAAPGDIIVTDYRVRYEPNTGLEKALWDDLGFDLAIDDLVEVKVVGLRRRLRLVTQDETYILGGTLMPRIYGLLAVLCDEGSTNTLGSQVMSSWKASYSRGVLDYKGELAASVRHIRFTPSGVLDAIVGMPDEIVIPLGEVCRVELKGYLTDRRVSFLSSHETHSFSMPDAQDRFVDFVQLYLQAESTGEPSVGVDGQLDNDVDQAVVSKSWASRLSHLSKIVLMGPAVQRPDKESARRGWIVLTETEMLFLPLGGFDGSEKHIAVPVEMLERFQPMLAPSSELHIQVAENTARFMPRGAQAFVDKFWALWRVLGPVTAAAAKKIIKVPDLLGDEEEAGEETGLYKRPVNRRRAFRVQLPLPVPIQVTTYRPPHGIVKDELKARLSDISINGCGIVCLHEIGKDLSIGLQIPHMGEVLDVRAKIVRTQKPRRRERYWRYGLLYSALSPYDEEQVVETVMDLQRMELTRRAELRNDSTEGEGEGEEEDE